MHWICLLLRVYACILNEEGWCLAGGNYRRVGVGDRKRGKRCVVVVMYVIVLKSAYLFVCM